MRSNNRGRAAVLRGAFSALFLLAGLNACASVAGGAALLGAVGLAALTSRCYDYVDVTVLDAEGRKTCAATVTANNGKSQFELPPCYNASLTDGRWTLRASLPGSRDATTTVVVDHEHDCTRYVQSVELTLNRADAPTQTRPPFSVPSTARSPERAQPTPAAPVIATPPPVQSSEPTPASSTVAPPSSSSVAPVGASPDNAQTPH